MTSNVIFAVTATGTAPLSYQWRVDGMNLTNGGSINGATTNVLIIRGAQTNNSGNYTVIVTNFGGSVTSSVASLIVASAPVILTQPVSRAIAVSSNATFTVTAIGTMPLSYQWQRNGTNLVNITNHISGTTNAILTISNAQTNDSGNSYSVIIANSVGSTNSSNATLLVTNIPPMIIVQPLSRTNVSGTTVTLTVTAIGTAPLSYQWQLNGINLVDGTNLVYGDITSGSTTNNLTISNVQTNDNGNYTVVVTGPGGSVTSSNAVLTVASSPLILTQPADQMVAVGAKATFTVTAIGLPPLSYQWRVNGTNLMDGTNLVDGDITSGSTTNKLTISNVPTNYSGNFYSVIIANSGGSATSSNALLTVASSPVITVQPAPTNLVVLVESNASFSVTAIGAAPLSYQWQINGTNLMDGTNLVAGDITSGSTTTNLIISNAQTNNSATNYTVVVTNILRIRDQFRCQPDGGPNDIHPATDQPNSDGGFDRHIQC